MIYTFENYHKTSLISNHLRMGGMGPGGDMIEVNNLYLTRQGKPMIPIMGEYHFVRDSRDNWYKELCKMKAGGIGIVATYMMWIYHEEEENVFDFSGDRDIAYFLECTKRAGMEVVLRIGPWAHGECRNGGFPDWLLKKGCKLRCNDPEYLRYAERFYRKIYQEVAPYLCRNGGNIIGIQFENELTDQPEHLRMLKEMALAIGFEAPLYTVTGWNNIYGARIPVEEVLPVFAAYVEAPWAESATELPLSKHFCFDPVRNDAAVGMDIIGKCDEDGWRLPYEKYPFATCELGPGLQMTHHRRVLVSGMDAYALSLVKLGCGNNLVGYYMYHGGNNKIGKLSTLNETMSTGYPNNYPVLDYDFQTCLSSYGQVRPQYELLNILHLFIKDREAQLATMEHLPATDFVSENNSKDLRYCMRTDGRSAYIFVNHYQRKAVLEDCESVIFSCNDVTLPPIDVRGDIAFILPVHLDCFTYATAQYICREENTYFFMAIPGIAATFRLEDGIVLELTAGDRKPEVLNFQYEGRSYNICLMTPKHARKLRKLDGQIYLGMDCNLYEMDGQICADGDGERRYLKWQGSEFRECMLHNEEADAKLSMEDCDQPFIPPYMEELQYGYPENPVVVPRSLRWKKLTVTGKTGFVSIRETYDVAQIYGDGELLADHFYSGRSWKLPVSLFGGKTCYMVMSEKREDIYLDK